VALRFDEIPEELLPGGYLFTDREDNPAVHGDEEKGGESYFDPAWDAVVDVADLDGAEEALFEDLLAAGMGDEVLVLGVVG